MNAAPGREPRAAARLREAILSPKRVTGMTHNVYRYPARFSPEFVQACLSGFSASDDIVLDPFVGGGTVAVESLAAGRRFVGFDLNPLATLLTRVKTTPLYQADRSALEGWLAEAFADEGHAPEDDVRLHNAPAEMVARLVRPTSRVDELPAQRQRDAARSVLLATGQWALDGRSTPIAPDELPQAAQSWMAALFAGLDEFATAVRGAGLRPGDIRGRRILRTAPAADSANGRGLNRLAGRVGLVVTSPPYPGVHVLYHRWQVGGRRETALPYWLADAQDGLGPKHYTMGGRSQIGQQKYFEAIGHTWRSLRRLLRDDAMVIQLVAFADPERQLPTYEAMMARAGFTPVPGLERSGWRQVPNRRWYNRVEPERAQGREILLAHSPTR